MGAFLINFFLLQMTFKGQGTDLLPDDGAKLGLVLQRFHEVGKIQEIVNNETKDLRSAILRNKSKNGNNS